MGARLNCGRRRAHGTKVLSVPLSNGCSDRLHPNWLAPGSSGLQYAGGSSMIHQMAMQTRRDLIAGSAAIGLGLAAAAANEPALAATGGGGGSGSIRPFRVNYPESALADLRRRIVTTRWPEQETVADDTQG